MRTALIVGAGIGGLSAGIALRKAGWNIRIFERAASPRELGFGLSLAPNAIAALGELGVADAVLSRAFAPERLIGEVRRLDGTVLKRADFPVVAALGGRMAIALRPALHGALLDAIGADSIALNSEARGFTLNGSRVTLHLNTGDVDGDLLVGADGMYSTIRRVLHPSERGPRASGLVAVRGAVHGQVHHLGSCAAVYYIDRGVEAAIVRASDTGIYWFISVARDFVPAGCEDPATMLAHLAPRFEKTLSTVTSATTELRFDEIIDRDPIPFWSRGVVTLLGDGAHPLLPQTGQGAAQAMVDAVVLGRILSANGQVESALKSYEDERRPRTTTLLGQGRRTARLMRMTNPFGCFLRETALRLIPLTTVTKLLVKINRRAGTDVRRT